MSERPGDSPKSLPELLSTALDWPQVEQLLGDIEACTQLLEILPKYAAQERTAGGTLTLNEARDLLQSRAVRALQIRYLYEGAEWWDTLMVAGSQFRVVRIRQNFNSPE